LDENDPSHGSSILIPPEKNREGAKPSLPLDKEEAEEAE
jgi:hypothetical protein